MAVICASRSTTASGALLDAKFSALPRGTRRALQRKLARSPGSLPRKVRRKLARSVAGAAFLLALAQAAQAATITVTTNKPDIKADGKCSLMEAVANANDDAATYPDCPAGNGADTILLPGNSTIVFSSSKTKPLGPTVSLNITSAITIQGNGSVLTRKNSKAGITLLEVWTSGDLIISNVSIEGFNNTALSNRAGGKLNVIESTMTGNTQKASGGAIQNGGDLTIERCTLSGNTSAAGAIFNTGNATIKNTIITNNAGTEYGGAITNYYGHLTITNSTISGNKVKSPKYSANGGAIFNIAGYLGIFDSSITENTVTGGGGLNKSPYQVGWAFGGAIDGSGTIAIRNSTISDNKAIGAPGRPALGGAIICGCSLTIENSTISGNVAMGGAKGGRAGAGAIWTSGIVSITNSTISGNSAVGSKGAASYAGGLMNYHYLTIDSSTITGNTASTQGGGIWNVETGGIVGGPSSTQLDLNRSVIAGNEAASGPELFNYQRLFTTVTADNHNLFGTNSDPGVSGFTPGASDIIPAAGVMIGDILAPLADNGGPTLTHALVPGSPAIDAAPVDADCPATDQRGVARPQGAMCDIGAFER
jgi:parallel beta helix pectate lyase-like protein